MDTTEIELSVLQIKELEDKKQTLRQKAEAEVERLDAELLDIRQPLLGKIQELVDLTKATSKDIRLYDEKKKMTRRPRKPKTDKPEK